MEGSEYKVDVRLNTSSQEVMAAREQGQNEAWEMARQICRLTDKYPKNKIFESGIRTTICAFTYAEAVELMRNFEESIKEIKDGDVVRINYCGGITERALVTRALSNGDYAVVRDDGIAGIAKKKDYTSIYRTGRTLPVEDWLRQIGEAK